MFTGVIKPGEIVRIGFFEEVSLVCGLSLGVVVLNPKETVVQGSRSLAWITVCSAAAGTDAPTAAGWSHDGKNGSASVTAAGVVTLGNLVQGATLVTDHHVLGVATVLGKEIPRKQVEGEAAGITRQHLDPEKRLDGNVRVPIEGARCWVVGTHLAPQGGYKLGGSLLVVLHIQPANFFPDNPRSHGIDIKADDVTTEAVGLDQGRAARP